LQIVDKIDIYNTDYKTALEKFEKNNKEFDIIFIDPPYSIGIAQNALELVEQMSVLSKGGIVAVEHDEKDEMPQIQGKLTLYKQKKYGSTKLSFYTYEI